MNSASKQSSPTRCYAVLRGGNILAPCAKTSHRADTPTGSSHPFARSATFVTPRNSAQTPRYSASGLITCRVATQLGLIGLGAGRAGCWCVGVGWRGGLGRFDAEHAKRGAEKVVRGTGRLPGASGQWCEVLGDQIVAADRGPGRAGRPVCAVADQDQLVMRVADAVGFREAGVERRGFAVARAGFAGLDWSRAISRRLAL
jgi:hypothetical protein